MIKLHIAICKCMILKQDRPNESRDRLSINPRIPRRSSSGCTFTRKHLHVYVLRDGHALTLLYLCKFARVSQMPMFVRLKSEHAS